MSKRDVMGEPSPRLLTLNMEMGNHKPREVGGFQKLGALLADSQHEKRDLGLTTARK